MTFSDAKQIIIGKHTVTKYVDVFDVHVYKCGTRIKLTMDKEELQTLRNNIDKTLQEA